MNTNTHTDGDPLGGDLRQALQDLTRDTAPATDLTARVLTMGRARRTRQRIALTAASGLALVVAVTLPMTINTGADPAPAPVTASSPGTDTVVSLDLLTVASVNGIVGPADQRRARQGLDVLGPGFQLQDVEHPAPAGASPDLDATRATYSLAGVLIKVLWVAHHGDQAAASEPIDSGPLTTQGGDDSMMTVAAQGTRRIILWQPAPSAPGSTYPLPEAQAEKTARGLLATFG